MTRVERYHQIIDTATKLFADKRFHEVTTDQIAQAAHVGKGTIYRYFKDKDDLYFHVTTYGFDILCEQVTALAQPDQPFEARLESAAKAIGAYFSGRRQRLQMFAGGRPGWLTAQHRERWLQTRQRLVEAVAAVLSCGVRDQVVRDDVPTMTLARLLLGLLRTRAMERQHDGLFGDLRFTLDFFLRGISMPEHAPTTRTTRTPWKGRHGR